VKVGRDFKPTIRNENSHEINNDNGFRTLAHLKTWLSKVPHCLIVTFINTLEPLLMERHTTRLVTF
jgi:hypothetical protein